jgi:prephenate dehydrogenase
LERHGTVAIIGVGLIGGSIGLALRARGLAQRVIGIGRTQATLADAERKGAIDAGTTDFDSGVAQADVTVVCTPVGQIAAAVIRAAERGPARTLVTDAGSTKRLIVEAVERNDHARAAFVASHPIAGSERKGVAHASAELLEGRVCVITPTAQTPAGRLDRARSFWASLGCELVEMTPEAHDQSLAFTSHMPHAVAAALAASIPDEFLRLAAGAYRDGTRVAASDPALWAGIFCANRQPVLVALTAFQDQLAAFRAALQAEDEEGLRTWWDIARGRRRLFDARRPTLGTESADGRH